MEVQADISASETASAVTCVSEKSNNTQNDNASTRALAGSMCRQVIYYSNQPIVVQPKRHNLHHVCNSNSSFQAMDSSNVSEDGASERVRFDNTIYHSVNSKDSIEKVCDTKTTQYS